MQTYWGCQKRVLFLTSVLFFILLLTGCGQLVGVGEQATNDQVGVTVTDVQFYDQFSIPIIVGGVKKPEKENQLFAIVYLAIENKSSEQQEVRKIQLTDKTGNKYSVPVTVSPPIASTWFLNQTIPPGEQMAGAAWFIVPEGAQLDRLFYASDPQVEISLESVTATRPASKPLPKTGEVASGGGIEMTVNSVSFPESLTYKLLVYKPNPGNKMMLLDVTVKNISIQPNYKTDPKDMCLIDPSGKSYTEARLVLGIPDSEKFQIVDLAPGSEKRGKIAITYPDSAVIKTFRYDNLRVLGPPVEVDVSQQ